MSSNTTKGGGERRREEAFLDQTLRPLSWSEYVGQKNTKENLRILLAAARERNHPPEHLLFYGPPGLGKTTLALLIGKELSVGVRVTSGRAIEKAGDLAAILTNLAPGEILFIDEIHRLHKIVEEMLYPALETGALDIIIGKGPSARTIQLELPPFTLIGATTRISLLSAPLRSRFSGGIFRLTFYSESEIDEILSRSARILGVVIKKDARREIAKRSRFTPRTANFLLKRCRDFAQIERRDLTREVVLAALRLLGVDDGGLDPTDRKILETIAVKFNGGPVGISTLAAATAEEAATIEEVNEPYLLQMGFLERTPRGRRATEAAYRHLGAAMPRERQEQLL